MRRTLVFATVLSLSACAAPDPAPDDVDALARFFLTRFDPGDGDVAISDQELQDGVGKIHGLFGDLSEPQKNILGSLTEEDVSAVGLAGHDPLKPQGMFIANIVHCTLAQYEALAVEPDQLSLYPEAYATYQRTIDEGTPSYLTTWTSTYTSVDNALFSNQYTAATKSGVRRVPDLGAASPHGPALLARVLLPEPAAFEEPGSEFSDDYQIETFHERAPGELVHFYAMWRFMQLGILGNSYDGTFVDQTLQGMIDWDTKTDALCAAGS
jgi:hypothetical protein